MATLKDVAEASGLTVGTVSRVLNNRGYISPKTREKVYRVMKELNYQPNETARTLAKQKSNIIGIVLPNVEHPYFAKILGCLEREAAKLGYRIMLFVSRNREEQEKQLVKGLIINKFRGDKTILDPGIVMLEELCHRSVVGVTPYMDIDVEDEDSLSERMSNEKVVGQIDLVVVRLPRISNFTDFNIFESIPGVSVRYVKRAAQLGNPDLILLPGTKNTMSDLAWMRQSGMEAAVLKAHAAGCPIFGICGGYQMLGEELSDPFGVEDGGTMRGMGLLPMHTVFTEEKTRTRVNGQFLQVKGDLAGLSDIAFSGYEIHMGQSVSDGKLSMLTKISDHCDHVGHTSEGSADGGAKTLLQSGSAMEKCEGAIGENVYGSYVHGIFDAQEVVNAIVKALAEKKGIDPAGLAQMDYAAYKETQYDKMADILRKHLDMEQIYRILDAGV